MVLQEISDSVTIPEALVHTGISMAIVFSVLILISFIIYLLKFVPVLLEGEKKKKAAEVPAAAPAKAEAKPAPVPAAPSNDAQIAAVIAAAIAAQMTEETGVPVAADGLVIRSIKKRTFSN